MKHINVMMTKEEEAHLNLWIKAVRAVGEAVYWACKLPLERDTGEYKDLIWLQDHPLPKIKKREALYKWSKTEMLRSLSEMAALPFEAFYKEYSTSDTKKIFLYAALSTLRYFQSVENDENKKVKDFNKTDMLNVLIRAAKKDKQTIRDIYDKAIERTNPKYDYSFYQMLIDKKLYLFKVSTRIFDRNLSDPRIIIAL